MCLIKKHQSFNHSQLKSVSKQFITFRYELVNKMRKNSILAIFIRK